MPNRPHQPRALLGALAALGIVVASGATGCGYNARDAHYAKRGVAIAGQPGDGSLALVRQSAWPDGDSPVTALAITPIEASRP